MSELFDLYVVEWEKNCGTNDLADDIRQAIRAEARHFVKNGWCRMENINNVCINPTMLHPVTYEMILDSSFPFDGYLPLQNNEELSSNIEDGVLITFCHEKLKTMISAYRHRINHIKIVVHLEDALEFCYNGTLEKFDVIECSNVADHTGLANLVNAISLRLSDSPKAMLITQSMYWCAKFLSVQQYVEHELCCSINFIPTMYGLRLEDHIELGSLVPDALRSPNCYPVQLCWKKAPEFRNLHLAYSPDLNNCLEQLAYRCFSVNGPLKTCKDQDEFNWLFYTPNTFNFIVDSISQRVNIDRCLEQLKIPRAFDLTRRATDIWKNGQNVLKLMTVSEGHATSIETGYCAYFNYVCMLMKQSGKRMLRLALLPQSSRITNSLLKTLGSMPFIMENYREILSGSDVHFIDNFQLDLTKTSGGEIFPKVSFILPPDHGLTVPYIGLLIDLDTESPILIFENVLNLHVEKYYSTYPIPNKRITPQTGGIKVESCIESLNGFALKVTIDSDNANGKIRSILLFIRAIFNIASFLGFNISTNCFKPCRSSHDVIISFDHQSNLKPLDLSFSHPILTDEISAIFHPNKREIDITLKKSVFEPWPCEFQAQHLRWKIDCMKPWKHGPGFNSWEDHTYAQLMPRSTFPEFPALSEVRVIIQTIFVKSKTICGDVFLSLRQKGSNKQEWLIRAHYPALISPLGSPLLALSTLEYRNIQESEVKTDIDRIFYSEITDRNTLVLSATAEELELFRYVLRLNSVKMIPSSWQRKNLPIGENKPFLATFLSPLYLDLPMDKETCNELKLKLGISFGENDNIETKMIKDGTHCQSCQKQSPNLKRCANCQSVFYCGVECQRLNWSHHKNMCKFLKDIKGKM